MSYKQEVVGSSPSAPTEIAPARGTVDVVVRFVVRASCHKRAAFLVCAVEELIRRRHERQEA